MRKTLTAGLTALSLVLIPAAPVQADSNEGLNRALLGLLAAGAIGLAISESQNKTVNTTVRNEPRSNSPANTHRRDNAQRAHRDNRQTQSTRRVDPLPSRCFRQIELGNGRTQSVFTERCLDRRYDDTASLPRQCMTRLGGRDGSRRGYEASCLRDRGFRTDRRW
jgi:hypothetical protein